MTDAMIEKGEFFRAQDRYLFEPYEEAMFHWDHRARTVEMKFVGQDFATPVPQDHRIYNEAIRAGREISRDEFEAGRVAA